MNATSLLYERWLAVARERGGELALVDGSGGRRWTFRELRDAGEDAAAGGAPILFPQGQNAGFIVALLAAWRGGTIACPIEPGQTAPDIPVPPPELNIAHLKLTSGSTGAAKCAAFTADQLAADARNIVAAMGLRPEWPNLGAISLAHSYGFSNLVLPLLLHGIPLLIVSAPLPEMVFRAAREFSAVAVPAVPALWRAWLASDAIPECIKLAVSAGAPLPLELERETFDRTGLKIHNFLGSTECGGIAFDRSAQPRGDSSLAGTALEHVSLSIGEAGTLIVEGAAVGTTYWPIARPELRAGRFVTTDLAEIAGGEIFLRGRVSDVINVAGRKVAPEAIEIALRAHPDIRECVAFGVPAEGSERLESIVAAVNASTPLSPSELSAFLSARLPAWQIPRAWWFCPDLQANHRGKIVRHEWRERYLARK